MKTRMKFKYVISRLEEMVDSLKMDRTPDNIRSMTKKINEMKKAITIIKKHSND